MPGANRKFEARFDRIERELGSLVASAAKIEAALIVRDPGNARSAEAYDGLRRQVAASAGERRRLLVILAELGEALRRNEGHNSLSSRFIEWSMQSGVVVECAYSPDHFDYVESDGNTVEIVQPAYVDSENGRTIRRGVASGPPLVEADEGSRWKEDGEEVEDYDDRRN